MKLIPARGRIDVDALLSTPLPSNSAEALKQVRSILNQSYVERRLNKLHTQDPFMIKMKDRIQRIAYTQEPVLITGPTGTGKELLASACVSASYRETAGDCPFVAVNCGAINKNLIESTFFGSTKGSYTGADKNTDGLLVQAGAGIMFLDEIGDLPWESQAALLRAIQENEIRPVGSATTVQIKCRFVAATKYRLHELVEMGRFRDDLYARISIYRIRTTPLSERPLDIPYIAKRLGWDDPLPPESLDHIYRYNVRGIQAVIANLRVFGEWIGDE